MRCILTHRPNAINGKEFEFSIDQPEWDKKWEKDIMYYEVQGYCRSLTIKQLRRALNLAMTTWDVEIPVTFKPTWQTRDTVSPDITIEFKSSNEDQLFKDRPSVLAYAYFPGQGSVSGKIVFNDDYIWDLSGKGIKAQDALDRGLVDRVQDPNSILRTYNVIHVLIHELGHSLGLRHDADPNSTDVMDTFYDGSVLDLSPRDIVRIRLIYGIRIFIRWTRYERLKRWLRIAVRRF